MPETTVTVEAVTTKEGAKNGKAWHKWSFKDQDGNWYSTFVGAVGEKFVKGASLTVEYEQTDYGRDVKKIKASGNNPTPVPSQNVAPPAMNGGDKDRAIIRQVAWKAAAALLGGREFKTDTELIMSASKVAHAIEHDIYRDTPAAPGTDESDGIPFAPTVMDNLL